MRAGSKQSGRSEVESQCGMQATQAQGTLGEWNGAMERSACMGGGSGHEPRDDGDVRTRKESEQRLEIDRPVQLLCLTVGASPEHLHRHSGRELENAICESLITAGGDSWMGMDGRRTSLTAPKNRIHRLWHSGLLLQQRWQHVGAEGEQAMQGDGGLGRCWVCGCGVGSALPAGRTVASTRSTEGERALRTRRGGAMLAAKQQIYLGGNYQPATGALQDSTPCQTGAEGSS
jgi:hypothetical protein